MRTVAVITLGILIGGLTYAAGNVNAPPAVHAVDASACTRLSLLKLPDATVTSARVVPAGHFQPTAGAADAFADLPAFCRVELTIKPSEDSDIKSETWLPLSGWNGKFQEVGNGGWNGFIQCAALAATLRLGYVSASTDTGHAGDTASFAPGHPEKLIDFGYRAVHETALRGKTVVAALYSVAPQFSYFTGCSGGGRQAFMEAQRYPEDFAGIIAGGLFGCAVDGVTDDGVQGLASLAIGPCMSVPSLLKPVAFYARIVTDLAAKGWIDSN